jgi:hypothetical protein
MELTRGVFPTAPLNPLTEECVAKPRPRERVRKAEVMVKDAYQRRAHQSGVCYRRIRAGSKIFPTLQFTLRQEHDIINLRKGLCIQVNGI